MIRLADKSLKALCRKQKGIEHTQSVLSKWMDSKATVNAEYSDEEHELLMAAVKSEAALEVLRRKLDLYRVFHYSRKPVHIGG